MKTALAVLIGSLLIAAAILGAQFLPIYRIYTAIDGNGNPMLWRVNSITGNMQMCIAKNIMKAKKNPDDPFNKVDPDYHPACE